MSFLSKDLMRSVVGGIAGYSLGSQFLNSNVAASLA